MMFINTTKLLTRSLVTAMGLGVALLALPEGAQSAAIFVNAGTDYVITPPGGGTFFFEDTPLGPGFVPVSFEGLPIGTPTTSNPDGGFSGLADTVINRLDSVDLTTSSEGVTALEIVGLSLQSLDVNGWDVFVGLQKYRNAVESTGTMTIRDDGTWDSVFDINGVAIFAPANTLIATGTDFVRGLVENCDQATNYQCENFTKEGFEANNEPWTNIPLSGTGENLVEPSLPNNFFLTSTVIHDAGDGVIHIIEPIPVPEPSTSAGLILLGLSSLFGFKRKSQAEFKDN